MKRLCLAILVMMFTFITYANTATIDGITWTYSIKNGKAEIGTESYGGNSGGAAIMFTTTGAITIPSTIF